MTGLNQETTKKYAPELTATQLIAGLGAFFKPEDIIKTKYVYYYFDKVYMCQKSKFDNANVNTLCVVLVDGKCNLIAKKYIKQTEKLYIKINAAQLKSGLFDQKQIANKEKQIQIKGNYKVLKGIINVQKENGVDKEGKAYQYHKMSIDTAITQELEALGIMKYQLNLVKPKDKNATDQSTIDKSIIDKSIIEKSKKESIKEMEISDTYATDEEDNCEAEKK